MNNQDLIKIFNEQFPVGSKVFWRSYAHEAYKHQEYEVRGVAFEMYGQAVAFLKGKAGCVSIEPQFVDYSRTQQRREILHPDGVREIIEPVLESEFNRI